MFYDSFANSYLQNIIIDYAYIPKSLKHNKCYMLALCKYYSWGHGSAFKFIT